MGAARSAACSKFVFSHEARSVLLPVNPSLIMLSSGQGQSLSTWSLFDVLVRPGMITNFTHVFYLYTRQVVFGGVLGKTSWALGPALKFFVPHIFDNIHVYEQLV